MRAPQEAAWNRTLERYFVACGLPIRWDGVAQRFQGIAGHALSRINPYKEDAIWAKMPMYLKRREQDEQKQAIVIVANRKYGDSVDDSIVVLRLGTFAPMLKAFYEADKERWSK